MAAEGFSVTSEMRGVSDAGGWSCSGQLQPLAFRIIERWVSEGGEATRLTVDEVDMIPSGTARLAVLQSMALAAEAVLRLARIEGRDALEVLGEIWPEKDSR